MRAKVDAKEFVQALERVSGLVRNSSIPVLNAVLVRFEADRCTLTSTNINTYLSAALPAQGDGFAFLLDRPRETARAFRQFEGELALEQTEAGEGDRRQITLTLSCGPRSAELHPFLPEDFPRGPKWEPRHSFTANAAKLYARVERVKYAVGIPRKEEARACLVSVQFSGDRIYALDGYRMAWDTDPELDISVPFMAAPDALEHLKLFGDQDVEIQQGDRFARVTDGVTSLLFRLPEGELFKLDSAIPDRFRAEFQVSPREFLAELKYLKQSLRGNRAHLVRFCGGRLLAESLGERYATKISAPGCEDVEFGFSLDYMMDVMERFKKEPSVTMKAGRLFVGLSDIDEVQADEIINLRQKKRSLFRFRLAAGLRSWLTRFTAPAEDAVDAEYEVKEPAPVVHLDAEKENKPAA